MSNNNVYVGKVIAVNKQRAKVKIEQRPGEQRPKMLDCWNACEAKRGTRVIVGKQSLDEKKAQMIVYGIPVLTALAGAAFGRAIAHFFSAPVWQIVVLSTLVWLAFWTGRTAAGWPWGWSMPGTSRRVSGPRWNSGPSPAISAMGRFTTPKGKKWRFKPCWGKTI